MLRRAGEIKIVKGPRGNSAVGYNPTRARLDKEDCDKWKSKYPDQKDAIDRYYDMVCKAYAACQEAAGVNHDWKIIHVRAQIDATGFQASKFGNIRTKSWSVCKTCLGVRGVTCRQTGDRRRQREGEGGAGNTFIRAFPKCVGDEHITAEEARLFVKGFKARKPTGLQKADAKWLQKVTEKWKNLLKTKKEQMSSSKAQAKMTRGAKGGLKACRLKALGSVRAAGGSSL